MDKLYLETRFHKLETIKKALLIKIISEKQHYTLQ